MGQPEVCEIKERHRADDRNPGAVALGPQVGNGEWKRNDANRHFDHPRNQTDGRPAKDPAGAAFAMILRRLAAQNQLGPAT